MPQVCSCELVLCKLRPAMPSHIPSEARKLNKSFVTFPQHSALEVRQDCNCEVMGLPRPIICNQIVDGHQGVRTRWTEGRFYFSDVLQTTQGITLGYERPIKDFQLLPYTVNQAGATAPREWSTAQSESEHHRNDIRPSNPLPSITSYDMNSPFCFLLELVVSQPPG